MTKQDTGRQQLIRGLQEDLAREYKAIIQYVVYSQAISEPQYMNIAQELEKHAHEELDHARAVVLLPVDLDLLGRVGGALLDLVQPEQVLVDGNQRSQTTSSPPSQAVL